MMNEVITIEEFASKMNVPVETMKKLLRRGGMWDLRHFHMPRKIDSPVAVWYVTWLINN